VSLYDNIWKRKSTRKYDIEPLGESQLEQISLFADGLKPIYPAIKTAFEISASVKMVLPIRSPHYIIISSEERDGYLENVGFMFQQLELYLSGLGLGTCWVGTARPSTSAKLALPFVIAIAFGNTMEHPHRKLSEFDRKPLSEISCGTDERLDAARLAPSASNGQNWFFAVDGGAIDVYQKKVLSTYDRLDKIAVGIALYHICAASEHSGKPFSFSKEFGKERDGMIYLGTVR
jgi:nitroreductase